MNSQNIEKDVGTQKKKKEVHDPWNREKGFEHCDDVTIGFP